MQMHSAERGRSAALAPSTSEPLPRWNSKPGQGGTRGIAPTSLPKTPACMTAFSPSTHTHPRQLTGRGRRRKTSQTPFSSWPSGPGPRPGLPLLLLPTPPRMTRAESTHPPSNYRQRFFLGTVSVSSQQTHVGYLAAAHPFRINENERGRKATIRNLLRGPPCGNRTDSAVCNSSTADPIRIRKSRAPKSRASKQGPG